MGMTDSQFKAYLRLLINPLKRTLKLGMSVEAKESLEEILTILQESLED